MAEVSVALPRGEVLYINLLNQTLATSSVVQICSQLPLRNFKDVEYMSYSSLMFVRLLILDGTGPLREFLSNRLPWKETSYY